MVLYMLNALGQKIGRSTTAARSTWGRKSHPYSTTYSTAVCDLCCCGVGVGGSCLSTDRRACSLLTKSLKGRVLAKTRT